jgi:hypothetical protein
MSIKTLIISTVFLLILATPNGIVAQDAKLSTKSKNSGNKSVPSGPLPYSSLPIEVQTKSLPPNYRGNDPIAVSQFLTTLESSFTKGEYETSPEHLERLRRVESDAHLGPLNFHSVFAFQVDLDQTLYDADNETFQLFLENGNANYSDTLNDITPPHITFELVDKRRWVGGYQGKTPTGVRATVQVWRNDRVKLAVINSQTFKVSQYTPTAEYALEKSGFVTELKMARTEVREIRPRIKALLLCKLTPPYFAREPIEPNTPTRDSPIEIRVYDSTIVVELLQIWFYDPVSGKILARVSQNPNPAVVTQIEPAHQDGTYPFGAIGLIETNPINR